MKIIAHTSHPTRRQSDILDRLTEMVKEHGLAGVTIKKLAARMGFSEAALYRHFPTKQAIVVALIDRVERWLLDPVRDIAGDDTRTIPDRITAILRHHVRLILEHDSLPILLFAEASASGDPVLLKRMQRFFGGYLSVLTDLLRRGQAAGEVIRTREASALALMLLGIPAGLALGHRLAPDERIESDFERICIPFLTRRLLRTEGDVR